MNTEYKKMKHFLNNSGSSTLPKLIQLLFFLNSTSLGKGTNHGEF